MVDELADLRLQQPRVLRAVRPVRTPSLALLFSTVALLISGCSQGQPPLATSSPGVVRIVSSLPSRGSTAAQTLEIEDAIRAALSQRGRVVGGSRVEYTALDDSDEETGDWSPQKEIANATAAANDSSVVAYIGPYNSGAAMLAIPIASRAGLIEISPSATWPGLTESGWDPGEPLKYYPSGERNFFRLMPPDSKQADAAAQWAAGQGQTSITVLDDGSSYSNGLANEFVTAAAGLGISVTNRIHLKLDPGADVLSQAGPARTFFYAPSSVGFALTVARALQVSHAVVYASDTALDPQFISQAGTAAMDWKIISNSVPPDSHGSFAASTKQGQTFPSQFAANAYDAMNLVLDGLASGSTTNRSELLNYVTTGTRNLGGTNGRIFDDQGDPESWVLSGYVVTPSGARLDRTISGRNPATHANSASSHYSNPQYTQVKAQSWGAEPAQAGLAYVARGFIRRAVTRADMLPALVGTNAKKGATTNAPTSLQF